MKIIFAGTTRFGIPLLERLLAGNHELAAVVTQPDRPVGRKQELTKTPIKKWTESNHLPALTPEKLINEAERLREISPDIMIVAAYGQIIPKEILEIPRFGSYNLHASLLPKYRGASPIQAALIEGEKETGVTVIRMDEKMDHGPMAGTIKVPIDDKDSFDALYDKLAKSGAELMVSLLPAIASNEVRLAPQAHEQATFTKILKRLDARINWTDDAYRIARIIRAYHPEPGAWTTLDQKTVKFSRAAALAENRIELPGKIYRHPRGMAVKCGLNILLVEELQPEGKKPMSGRDYLNGLKNLESKIFV